ncbi:uncharacterized protein B0I36DRAFT_256822, partial [Microdochium trichocladiopsis]
RLTYMGIYAFTLASSNYFTPVICGLIAEYHRWQWVFYWPALFLAFVFILLLFFMEETNYTRTCPSHKPASTTSPSTASGAGSSSLSAAATSPAVSEPGETYPAIKTYMQKLSIWQPSPGQGMLSRALRSVRFLSWPIIFYAGFSYGTYLISFNVLNATASMILSGEPYNFPPSLVGISYFSCCVNMH